jgi:hypothetical protein
MMARIRATQATCAQWAITLLYLRRIRRLDTNLSLLRCQIECHFLAHTAHIFVSGTFSNSLKTRTVV